MKKVLGFTLMFVLSGILSFGQNSFKGTLSINDDKELSGTFNNKVDKKTTALSFTDETGKVYNVLALNGALAYYEDSNKYFISFLEEQNFEMLEVIVMGDARLYKSLKTQKLYTENVKLDTGIVELINASDLSTNKTNRGKLLVIFKDCQSIRERTYDSDLRFNSIKLLVEGYNQCPDINDEFQITGDEQRAQKYADEKTIVTFDVGAGYYSIDSDIKVLSEDSFYSDSDQSSGFSLYASMNVSPNYFYGYTGKVFADFSLQYNFRSDLEYQEVSQSVSNLNLMFTPKFYFGNTAANFRPFVGFGVGLSILFIDIEDLTESKFPDDSDTSAKFIYGPQFGILLFNKIELSTDFFPYFSDSLFFNQEDVRVETTFNSFAIKLGYNF